MDVSGIYRIKKFLPESLYKQIYHSLFESHLGYAISVWGGIPNNQLKPLFITQKKCIRILFGDFEAYVDKFKTCARARPINSQRLGTEFYVKESTKPLFTKYELLAIENLYRYRCLMELFKIIKLRVPISLYDLFGLSNRKDNLLITPSPTNQFIYKSAWLWNEFRKVGNISGSLLLATLERAFLITSFLQGVIGDMRWVVLGSRGSDFTGYRARSFPNFSFTSSTRAFAVLFSPHLKLK